MLGGRHLIQQSVHSVSSLLQHPKTNDQTKKETLREVRLGNEVRYAN